MLLLVVGFVIKIMLKGNIEKNVVFLELVLLFGVIFVV